MEVREGTVHKYLMNMTMSRVYRILMLLGLPLSCP